MRTWLNTGILGLLVTGCTMTCPPARETFELTIEGEPMGAPQDIANKTGWQKAGKLRTGKVVDTVQALANFPKCEYYTVQFGVTPPVIPAGWAGFIDVRADVLWSVEGVTTNRTLSIGNGAAISGSAQGIKVIAYDRTVLSGGVGAIPHVEYDVIIQITPGTRPSKNQPPVLNSGLATLQFGPGFVDSIVNPDAGIISVDVTVGQLTLTTAPLGQVEHLNFFGQILKMYDPSIVTGFVPLATGTTLVRYSSREAATTHVVQFTYGIDG